MIPRHHPPTTRHPRLDPLVTMDHLVARDLRQGTRVMDHLAALDLHLAAMDLRQGTRAMDHLAAQVHQAEIPGIQARLEVPTPVPKAQTRVHTVLAALQ